MNLLKSKRGCMERGFIRKTSTATKKGQKKRFADSPPIFTVYAQLRCDGILVRCPKCGGAALLKNVENGCRLTCFQCHFGEHRTSYTMAVSAQGCCIACERWFNLRLLSTQSTYKRVKIKCPHCSTVQIAKVRQIGTESQDQLEGLSLYLQASFRGHTVWALNAAHLDFLIHFVEANLRDKYLYAYGHGDKYCLSGGMSGQSHRMPTWMKTAKNRAGLLSVLKKLQKSIIPIKGAD